MGLPEVDLAMERKDNMPLHNYQCADGHMTEGIYSPASKVRKTIKCACGKRAKQHWGHYKNGQGHNWAMKSKGYAKGVIDPQTGVDYQNYAEKQRVYREVGVEEAGAPLTVEQIHEQDYEDAQTQEAQRTAHEAQPVLQAESMEELNALIAGDMQERQVVNPEHGQRTTLSEDGWVSF